MAGQSNSCIFIFQTLLDPVPRGMVRDVSQEIVPYVVTPLVVVIRGQLLLKRESAQCNLMPW